MNRFDNEALNSVKFIDDIQMLKYLKLENLKAEYEKCEKFQISYYFCIVTVK